MVPKSEATDICDFCSDPHPTRVYTSPEMEIEAVADGVDVGGMLFDEDWAACDICGDMIDAGDWDALLTRASSEFYAHHPDVAVKTFGNTEREQGMRDALKLLYDGLRNAGIRRVV